MSRRHPFRERLTGHMNEAGMTVEELVDAAQKYDPGGYTHEGLRSFYNGSRPFTYRAMLAFAKAVEVPAAQFPELRLAYAQTMIDDGSQGMEQALKNLDRLDPEGKLDPDADDVKLPPIKGRRKKMKEAEKKAQDLERRLSSDGE